MNLHKSQHKKLNKTIPRQVIIKITDKEKILKAPRNKTHIWYCKGKYDNRFLLRNNVSNKTVDQYIKRTEIKISSKNKAAKKFFYRYTKVEIIHHQQTLTTKLLNKATQTKRTWYQIEIRTYTKG